MLALGHEREVAAPLWETCDRKARLPVHLASRFFEEQGAMPLHFDSQRTFHRFYMRGKAVLTRGDERLGAYTKDVSRQGVGFLSPIQLMPLERVRLQIRTTELALEVARCRRVSEQCFEIGARYVL